MPSFLTKLVALSSLAALVVATHEPRFAKHRRHPAVHVPSPTLATLALAPSATSEAPLSNAAAVSSPLAAATSTGSRALADSASLAYGPSSVAPVAAATASPSPSATAAAPPSIDVTVLQLAFVLEVRRAFCLMSRSGVALRGSCADFEVTLAPAES